MKIKHFFSLACALCAALLITSCSKKSTYDVTRGIVPDADMVIEVMQNVSQSDPAAEKKAYESLTELAGPEVAALVKKYNDMIPEEARKEAKMLVSFNLPDNPTAVAPNPEELDFCVAMTLPVSLQNILDESVKDLKGGDFSFTLIPGEDINGMKFCKMQFADEAMATCDLCLLLSADGKCLLILPTRLAERQSAADFEAAPVKEISEYRAQLSKDTAIYFAFAPAPAMIEPLTANLMQYGDFMKSIKLLGLSYAGTADELTVSLQAITDNADNAKKFHDETLAPILMMAKFIAPQAGFSGDNSLPCLNTLRSACTGSTISLFCTLTQKDIAILQAVLPELGAQMMPAEGEEE